MNTTVDHLPEHGIIKGQLWIRKEGRYPMRVEHITDCNVVKLSFDYKMAGPAHVTLSDFVRNWEMIKPVRLVAYKQNHKKWQLQIFAQLESGEWYVDGQLRLSDDERVELNTILS